MWVSLLRAIILGREYTRDCVYSNVMLVALPHDALNRNVKASWQLFEARIVLILA